MIAKPNQLRRHAESMPSGSFVPVERDDLLDLLTIVDAAKEIYDEYGLDADSPLGIALIKAAR